MVLYNGLMDRAQGEITRKVKKKTFCSYYPRSHLLFVPGDTVRNTIWNKYKILRYIRFRWLEWAYMHANRISMEVLTRRREEEKFEDEAETERLLQEWEAGNGE